jgi:hypothetical protein
MFHSKNIKWLFVVLVVFVLASAVYAFAASNTVPDSKAGDGSGAITGYSVSNVLYVLNTDPTKLDTVKFTLDAAATTVKARLVSGSGTWFACTVITGSNYQCAISGAVNVLDANSLQVVAVQ